MTEKTMIERVRDGQIDAALKRFGAATVTVSRDRPDDKCPWSVYVGIQTDCKLGIDTAQRLFAWLLDMGLEVEHPRVLPRETDARNGPGLDPDEHADAKPRTIRRRYVTPIREFGKIDKGEAIYECELQPGRVCSSPTKCAKLIGHAARVHGPGEQMIEIVPAEQRGYHRCDRCGFTTTFLDSLATHSCVSAERNQ